jgi:hypothetical protein
MTMSKVCCGPRKVAAGEGRGREETREDANNPCHREGEVKDRKTGPEAYGRYKFCENILIHGTSFEVLGQKPYLKLT